MNIYKVGVLFSKMASGLEGRLEVAEIIRPIRDTRSNCAIGKLLLGNRDYNNGNVLVANAVNHIGKKCLVRLDNYLRQGINMPFANFISSSIPDNPIIEDLHGLKPEDYLFYGMWTKELINGNYPTFNEINNLFDPGKMGSLLFFKNRAEKAVIWLKNFRILDQYQPDLLIEKNHKSSHDGSKVILIQSRDFLTYLKGYAREKDISLIEMEPLR